MFPHVSAPIFTLHNEITLNGGAASVGDVVSFAVGGQTRVGKLLLNVGVASGTSAEKPVMFSLVTVWEMQVHADTRYAHCKVNRRDSQGEDT